jgi:hypothetical protein
MLYSLIPLEKFDSFQGTLIADILIVQGMAQVARVESILRYRTSLPETLEVVRISLSLHPFTISAAWDFDIPVISAISR